MEEEIILEEINWTTPEYDHKERNADWFWAIGIITVIAFGIAIWFHNYLFSIFILISGACLILFSIRPPLDIDFSISTGGFKMGKDLYEWKKINGFNIKKNPGDPKLLIETSSKFLPIYTISIPEELIPNIKESLEKVTKRKELEESLSMKFMEKLGF